MPDELPEPVADLDARALRAWIERADMEDPACDDVVMVISDGDVTVRIVSGIGGRQILARFGAERLNIVAEQYAHALAIREDPERRAAQLRESRERAEAEGHQSTPEGRLAARQKLVDAGKRATPERAAQRVALLGEPQQPHGPVNGP